LISLGFFFMPTPAETYNNLLKEIEVVEWDALADHYKRGAILVVKEGEDLAKVGMCIADDRVDQIKKWLSAGILSGPDDMQVKLWKTAQEIAFKFIIVQPYVLVQVSPKEAPTA
jgi:hypothetical protein